MEMFAQLFSFQLFTRGEIFGLRWRLSALTGLKNYAKVGLGMRRFLAIIGLAAWLAGPLGAAEFEVPFELDGKRNAILVKVKVNGRNCIFLVDTGASHTIVSHTALGVSRVELKRARFKRGPGVAGEATWEEVRSLRLGQSRWHDRRIVVMNLDHVSQVFGRRIDGLLGQDLLMEFDLVQIDYKTRRISLSR